MICNCEEDNNEDQFTENARLALFIAGTGSVILGVARSARRYDIATDICRRMRPTKTTISGAIITPRLNHKFTRMSRQQISQACPKWKYDWAYPHGKLILLSDTYRYNRVDLTRPDTDLYMKQEYRKNVPRVDPDKITIWDGDKVQAYEYGGRLCENPQWTAKKIAWERCGMKLEGLLYISGIGFLTAANLL